MISCFNVQALALKFHDLSSKDYDSCQPSQAAAKTMKKMMTDAKKDSTVLV